MDSKKVILMRVYLLYALMLLFGAAIIGRIVYIQFWMGDALLAKSQQQEFRVFSIEAMRGNIMSDDGSLLATSIPIFEVRMDVGSPNIDQQSFDREVDSLAHNLSVLFPETSKSEFLSELKNARREGNRYLLLQNKVSYEKLKKLKKFPIIRRGKYKGGLILVQHDRREKPYKELASRTIGYENTLEDLHVGLEGAYHEDLKGTEGKQLRRKINSGDWKPVFDGNELEPQNGKDVVSTIDIVIQDVAEGALRRNLTENNAQQGCAILMEVATGQIKAIANLVRDDKTGEYFESYNYAIRENVEPGSTFKLASMLVLLDDNKVDLNDHLYIGNGQTMYYNQTMKDVHGIRDGNITVAEAFEHSSNVGISKLVYNAYKNNPEAFIDKLYSFGINKSLGIELSGEGEPHIKHPSDKQHWSGTSLPWMSIGYELSITPLQMLTLYNAVANNGKMVKPLFVKEIRQGGIVIKSNDPVVLNEAIVSAQAIQKARKLLEGVVENGTGKSLKNSVFKIAGKTGTAQIASGSAGYNKVNYNASFAGYFPADNPRYSCIVVVNNPSMGKIYGGAVAAPVFKEIADKIYATRIDIHDNIAKYDTVADSVPVFRGPAYFEDVHELYASLNILTDNRAFKNEWITSHSKPRQVLLDAYQSVPDSMPDFSGMNGKDAVYLIEQMGMYPKIKGNGMVVGQSVPSGSPRIPGQTIELQLQNL
ncbi:MAG: penicillin-binding protein [Bacteroidales bacterium]